MVRHKASRRGGRRGGNFPSARASLALAVAASFAVSPEARAQLAGGGLTDNGPVGVNGSLRDAVSTILSPPTTVNTGLPWTFSGAIDVEAGATDSPGGTNTSDWQPLILLAPDLSLTGVTSRLNVALSYSPRLTYYPSSSGESLFSHTFNGNATAVVVPDWLYFNARGLTGVSSRFGYSSLQANTFYSRGDAVQTSSFSVSPYLQRTIGGIGTVTVGYVYSASFQDDNGNVPYNFIAPNAVSTAGYGATGNLRTNTEYASFTSGENLGRVQYSGSISAGQNSGSPFYQGSTTLQDTNQVSYALYRWLTLLASVGYEEYKYPNGGYNLTEPSWSVGFTLIPNADSSLTLRYGQTSGIDTILFDGTYSPTPRTRIYANYNVQIETGLGARQGLLGTTNVGPGGMLVDRVSGAPVLSNNYLASQYPLSRVKALTVGGLLLLARDTFSASVSYTKSTQLVNSTDILGITTAPGTTTDSTYGTVAWQHDLNPSNSLYSSISYGVSNNGVYFGVANGSQDTFQLYSTLTHTFTDTLTGSVSYSHAERYGGAVNNLPANFGGSASQNTVLVGLRKSF